MKELEILLENRWILHHENKDRYYEIKDRLQEVKKFTEEKLGYQLIVNPYMIKLEKLPGKAEGWMGIDSFEDPMEYGFLCLILMFLEDKGREEQFVLSQITEFIQGAYPGEEKIDWTLYKHRRSLIKVLRFCSEEGLMKVDDGDDNQFANEQETEVLYESTGVSRYFMRNFTESIMDYTSYEDFENNEWMDMDQDRGQIRRHRVYRRLVMGPAVYREGTEDPDYMYIKQYRHMVEQDIETYLDSQLHVHKNGAFLVLGEDKHFKDTFPDNKNISDIVLQLSKLIIEGIQEERWTPRENDTILMSRGGFEGLIEQCRERNVSGWSKLYRDMSLSKLVEEILTYMTQFQMLQRDEKGQEVLILPLAGKMTGVYPEDYRETT